MDSLIPLFFKQINNLLKFFTIAGLLEQNPCFKVRIHRLLVFTHCLVKITEFPKGIWVFRVGRYDRHIGGFRTLEIAIPKRSTCLLDHSVTCRRRLGRKLMLTRWPERQPPVGYYGLR